MKISLNLEKTKSNDVSIMVDAFRASTSITIALNKFEKIIPAFSPQEAENISKQTNSVLVGERNGVTLDGFDLGNSPVDIGNYETDKKNMVLTTSNGTRILKDMKSTVLIGCFLNADSVAKSALEIAKNHVDVVMAGWKGNFAMEDFLASGEILYHLEKLLKNSKNRDNNKNTEYTIEEYAQSAILASRNQELDEKYILNTRSAKKLKNLGFEKDVEFSLKRNLSKNVAIYKKGVLELLK